MLQLRQRAAEAGKRIARDGEDNNGSWFGTPEEAFDTSALYLRA